jgi:hypothetical protein
MVSPRKTTQKLISDDELPEATNKAVGKVELVIETQRSAKIFFLRATREGCEITFRWNRLLAGITAMVTLVVGVRKYWS